MQHFIVSMIQESSIAGEPLHPGYCRGSACSFSLQNVCLATSELPDVHVVEI